MAAHFASLGADPELAQHQALLAIDAIARRQSQVMAFNDAFYVIGAAFIISLLVIACLKKVPAAGGQAPAAD
jgi:DHA2 family multidrug resistance protein